MSVLQMLAASPAIQRLTEACDVIHVIAEPYVLAAPIKRRMVVTAHGTYIPRTTARPIVGALYRPAYRRSTIICVSSFTQRQVMTALPGARTVVIPNGVDATRFQQSSPVNPLPAKHGPIVLSVGQLKARKGFHILAAAMVKVRQAVSNAEAVFIGDTSDRVYYETLQAQLARDQLTDVVHLLGRVSEAELLDWYQSADVFALPAINAGDKFEGFGLVYLEANAAGLPAIGTLDCGAEDAIRDGETGYLVPQNDVDATADALIKLLRDPSLRIRMGASAKAYAQSQGWDAIARRVLEVYRADTLPRVKSVGP
jgi:phosphatidylinositol alpha-1,6-mannosyltransferase